MSQTTIWLQKQKAPDLFAALQMLLKDSSFVLNDLPTHESGKAQPDTIGLIPWFSLRPGAFVEELCNLWEVGCRDFIVVTPAKGRKPWTERDLNLPSHTCAALDAGIPVWDNPTVDAMKTAINAGLKVPAWAKSRVRQFTEARFLYHRFLYKFSHNSQTDLSNQFLAPARLLKLGNASVTKEQIQKWKNTAWEGRDSPFVSGKLEKVEASGDAGQELGVAARRISASLTSSDVPEVADLENFMTQITRIRETAGLHTRITGDTPSKDSEFATPIGDASAAYRVLVVDDHAAAWRPVFEKLQVILKNGIPNLKVDVGFDFSLDGKFLSRGADQPAMPADFSQFDLVILDIFLRGSRGTDTLNRLRRDFSQLPVLLWTTSRDEEITAEAMLANGVLLKKTVTWSSLTEAVARWVQHGKAMRTTSLPNPFFNHTIKNLEYRTLAVDFHEWCLKQLDSFHALDNEYFRYFTDHGGRHIVKLWELLEQALQPFLQNEGESFLPNDPKRRELEILCLYLTVVSHELGMFPMSNGRNVEDFATLGSDYLDDVRSLHAARGMVLLQDATGIGGGIGKYWNDTGGRALGAALLKYPGLTERLAVLVGYHARLFKSLSAQVFLHWEIDKEQGAKYDLARKLAELASPVPSLSRTDEAFEAAFKALSLTYNLDLNTRERLRRQCALFRFVDALDITASRNPADFLVGSGQLPFKQYCENFKRELCSGSCIRNGAVQVTMKVCAPSVAIAQNILRYVAQRRLMGQKDQHKADKAFALVQDGETAQRVVEKPWLPPPEKACWDISAIQDSSPVCLQKPLDCWLKEVWSVLVNRQGNSDFIQHLRDLGILTPGSQEPRLLFEGGETIASITVLSVAGELLDEYQAIVESELNAQIQLPEFGWGNAWEKDKLPDGLTTLGKVLPSPEAATP